MGELRILPGVTLRGKVVWPETDDYEIYVNGATPSDEETTVACVVSDLKDLLHRRRSMYPPLLWRSTQRKVVYALLKDPFTISHFTQFGQASGVMELLNCLPTRMQRKLLKNGTEEALRAAGQTRKIEIMQSRWWKPFRPVTRRTQSQRLPGADR